MKKIKYGCEKLIIEWIDSKVFEIHEYNNTRNRDIYKKLVSDLAEIVKYKRSSFKISFETSLGDICNVIYVKNKNKHNTHFKLQIYEKYHKLNNWVY